MKTLYRVVCTGDWDKVNYTVPEYIREVQGAFRVHVFTSDISGVPYTCLEGYNSANEYVAKTKILINGSLNAAAHSDRVMISLIKLKG